MSRTFLKFIKVVFDYKNPENHIRLFTAVIAFATVFNLGISFFMWLETNRSVNVAREFYESTNRPFVVFNHSYIILDNNIKTISTNCGLQNIGNTPSRKFEITYNFVFKNSELTYDKIIPEFYSIYPLESVTDQRNFNDSSFTSVSHSDTLKSILVKIIYSGIVENVRYSTVAKFEALNLYNFQIKDTFWE